jgi:dephospho-CoA kinase
MKLIGLSGTNGAGKDSVAEVLRDNYGYYFISVTDLLREEARKRGLAVERENLRMISAEWRRESGLGVLIDKAIETYKKLGGDKNYNGLVVSSLRNPGENDTVHKLNGKVIWIDADPKIRYERIFSRQRTDEDNKTYEQFLIEEQAEMNHEGDKATLSLLGVKQKSDITLINEGSKISELEKMIENQIKAIL